MYKMYHHVNMMIHLFVMFIQLYDLSTSFCTRFINMLCVFILYIVYLAVTRN